MSQFSLAAKIMGVIAQMEGINFRKLYLKAGVPNQGRLARILCDMQDLAFIERIDQEVGPDSPRRGLKPRFETHYKLTSFGRVLLQHMLERIPHYD